MNSRPFRQILREAVHQPAVLIACAGTIPVALGVRIICDNLLSLPTIEEYARSGTFVGMGVFAAATMAINVVEALKPNSKSPEKAEEFHHESARQADKLFTKELRRTKYKSVILLNGGTASGKSEFLSTELRGKRYMIYDATLSTPLGAEIKLKQIIKCRKKAIIYAVIPDNLKRAFIAFLSRERKFSDSHFYTTHSGSRKTLLWIAENYPQVQINIIESSYTPSQVLQFTQIEFAKRQQLIEYLRSIQMTEGDIITVIIKV